MLFLSLFQSQYYTPISMSQQCQLSLSLSIYIYIYCHPPIDCFVLSELFSVARQARFPKLGSKPGWLERQFKVLPLYTYIYGLAVRVFANGPGDLGSIPGRVIPKTQKMVLDASLLNTQHYKVRIKGKVKQSREGVAPSPTPWCSSYRKGSLRVTLDYGRQLYFFYL